MATEKSSVFQIKNIPEQVFQDFKIHCIRENQSMNAVCNNMILARTYGDKNHESEVKKLTTDLDDSRRLYNDLLIKAGIDPDSVRKPDDEF